MKPDSSRRLQPHAAPAQQRSHEIAPPSRPPELPPRPAAASAPADAARPAPTAIFGSDLELQAANFARIFDNLSDGVYFVDQNRRITYWNRRAQEITGHSADEVLGKRCADQVLVHVDESGLASCGAACPLSICLRDGSPQQADLYLRHKQGHRVPVRVRVLPLTDATGTPIGAVEVFTDRSHHIESSSRMAELEEMAFIDSLTRLANRRFLDLHVGSRLQELERFGWPFGVLMFDIDRFKGINDNHGHAVGDQVLAMVARTALSNARPFDLVCRYGGEEFVQVVSNVDGEALEEVSERLRALVERSALIADDRTVAVTVSVGAATARPGDTFETLIERVDAMLYRSKREGRNRVSIATSP